MASLHPRATARGDAPAAAAAPPAAAAPSAPEWRTNGLGAQILHDLGVHELKVLGTPRHYLGLSGFGISVADQTAS